ncbi:MAG: NAD-dependent protein deacylase [Synergistaceae bacterium]|jgi:NAD-dependent deacetylase|nr:NAD-dependent protein deacylase [Synergistaceae bacterium]
MKKKFVVLTGAGISAESGMKTFRDNDGMWEEYDVMEVASIDGWRRNPALVQEFYNQRRRQLEHVEPNEAHKILAELERDFDMRIVTQNVDNLHERAGSTKVIHLHGLLTQARSVNNPNLVVDIGYRDIKMGETASDGAQLRPNIVWFGEDVPLISEAAHYVREADLFAVIGSSLVVYPAAGLVSYLKPKATAFLIDPKGVEMRLPSGFVFIQAPATTGTARMRDMLLDGAGDPKQDNS